MIKYILFTLFAFAPLSTFSFSHDAYELAAFGGEPSSIVDGCVSAITGDYLISSNLLTVRGHEPIQFDSKYFSYLGTSKLGGWGFLCNHLMANLLAYRSFAGVTYYLQIPEKVGISLSYLAYFKKMTKDRLPFILVDFPAGLTNCFSGEIGARLNLLNNSVWRDLKDKKQFIVEGADGSKRCYRVHEHKTFDKPTTLRQGPIIDTVPLYLCWETLPNGNIIRYYYQKINDQYYLNQVKALSSDQKTVYSWANITLLFQEKERLNQITIQTSDNQELILTFDPHQKIGKQKFWLLRNTFHPSQPNESYDYGGWDKEGCYLNKHLYPEGRGKQIEYYHQGGNQTVRGSFDIKGLDHPLYKKVKQLSTPINGDQTFYPSKHFFYETGEYQLNGGTTDVFDSHHNLTRYHYNESFLLTRIERFIGEHTLFSTELFHWHPKNSSTPNYLYGKTLLDGTSNALLSTLNQYDAFGNVITKSLHGNLTGHKENGLYLNGEGLPELTATETCATRYEFYPNNLKFKEYFPNGKSIEYLYLQNTDLLSSQLVYDGPHIKIRKFFFYEGSVKVQEVTDDGSEKDFLNLTNVSIRQIKTFVPITVGAFIGFPKEIREECIEIQTGTTHLQKKTCFQYNSRGLIEKSDHFDSQEVYRYSLNYFYDPKGRLIKTTDALGREKEVRYDANDNIIYEKQADDPFSIETTFDYSNRPINHSIVANNGASLSTCNRYNNLHQKTEEIDAQGNTTSYTYNPFGHTTTICHPPFEVERPNVVKTFNALGKAIKEIDPLGFITQTFYTSRGKPYRIIFPDNSEEAFFYTLDGELKTHISKGGVKTEYIYDFLNRLIEKRIFCSEGNEVSKQSWSYGAFHLKEKIDPDGVKTTYTYDYFNRLIKTEVLGKVIEQRYDALGRVSHIIEGPKVNVKEYDPLDRIVEEREEDIYGNLFGFTNYFYDAQGKKISEKKEVFGSEAITSFEYDPFGRLSKTSLPNGETTHTIYIDQHINKRGQRVKQKKIQHPIGREEVITFNPAGKEDTTEIFCKEGTLLCKETFSYDYSGRKIAQKSNLFHPEKTIFKHWEYTCLGQLSCLKEGSEAQQKATHFLYTKGGYLKTKIKPCGGELDYTWDALGRNTSIVSSDGTVNYYLTYNAMGYILSSLDRIHNRQTIQTLDHFGNSVEETLSNGLTIRRSYDTLDRKTALYLPEGIAIEYLYDPYHLKAICRKDEEGNTLYTHKYTSYDKSHNLLEEDLPSRRGLVTHTIDLNGRRVATLSPYCSEEISSFDESGNVLEYERTSSHGRENTTFLYDYLDQLIEESGPFFNHSYRYDSHFNRIQKDGEREDQDSAHVLISSDKCIYENDSNGNRTRLTSSHNNYNCRYDGLDRMIEIETPTQKRLFTYDFFNRLSSQKIFLKVYNDFHLRREEFYLYDGQNELGTTDCMKILGENIGAEIGAAIAIEKRGEILIPMHDLFGNIIALENSAGHFEDERRFSAFGEEIVLSPIKDIKKMSPWGYQSKRHIAHFIHFGRRLYDPVTGRWLTADPKSYEEGPNLYQFLKNAPLLHHDLYGESIERLKSVDDLISNASQDICFEQKLGGPYSKNWTYFPEKDYSQNENHPLIRGEKQINFIGGIKNSFEEHQNNVKLLSRYANNMPIHSTYNATHGLQNDIRESKMGLNLTATPPAMLFAQMKRDFFAKASPNAVCLDILHSQGAIHGLLSQLFLPPDERRRVVQLCIAPAAYQPKHISKRALHFISSQDSVPQLQQIWGKLPRRPEHLTTLQPHPGDGRGHSFSSKMYQKPITDLIKRYIDGEFDESP